VCVYPQYNEQGAHETYPPGTPGDCTNVDDVVAPFNSVYNNSGRPVLVWTNISCNSAASQVVQPQSGINFSPIFSFSNLPCTVPDPPSC
jgi:hypothetical protein